MNGYQLEEQPINSTLIEPGFDETNDEEPDEELNEDLDEEPNEANSLEDHKVAWDARVDESMIAASEHSEVSEDQEGEGEAETTETQAVGASTKVRTKRLTEFEKNLDIEQFGYSPTLFHFCLPLSAFSYHY